MARDRYSHDRFFVEQASMLPKNLNTICTSTATKRVAEVKRSDVLTFQRKSPLQMSQRLYFCESFSISLLMRCHSRQLSQAVFANLVAQAFNKPPSSSGPYGRISAKPSSWPSYLPHYAWQCSSYSLLQAFPIPFVVFFLTLSLILSSLTVIPSLSHNPTIPCSQSLEALITRFPSTML